MPCHWIPSSMLMLIRVKGTSCWHSKTFISFAPFAESLLLLNLSVNGRFSVFLHLHFLSFSFLYLNLILLFWNSHWQEKIKKASLFGKRTFFTGLKQTTFFLPSLINSWDSRSRLLSNSCTQNKNLVTSYGHWRVQYKMSYKYAFSNTDQNFNSKKVLSLKLSSKMPKTSSNF